MWPYLGPPWTNSCKIWCVRVFHHVLLKYGHENAETQKRKFDDVSLQYSITGCESHIQYLKLLTNVAWYTSTTCMCMLLLLLLLLLELPALLKDTSSQWFPVIWYTLYCCCFICDPTPENEALLIGGQIKFKLSTNVQDGHYGKFYNYDPWWWG